MVSRNQQSVGPGSWCLEATCSWQRGSQREVTRRQLIEFHLLSMWYTLQQNHKIAFLQTIDLFGGHYNSLQLIHGVCYLECHTTAVEAGPMAWPATHDSHAADAVGQGQHTSAGAMSHKELLASRIPSCIYLVHMNATLENYIYT